MFPILDTNKSALGSVSNSRHRPFSWLNCWRRMHWRKAYAWRQQSIWSIKIHSAKIELGEPARHGIADQIKLNEPLKLEYGNGWKGRYWSQLWAWLEAWQHICRIYSARLQCLRVCQQCASRSISERSGGHLKYWWLLHWVTICAAFTQFLDAHESFPRLVHQAQALSYSRAWVMVL